MEIIENVKCCIIIFIEDFELIEKIDVFGVTIYKLIKMYEID